MSMRVQECVCASTVTTYFENCIVTRMSAQNIPKFVVHAFAFVLCGVQCGATYGSELEHIYFDSFHFQRLYIFCNFVHSFSFATQNETWHVGWWMHEIWAILTDFKCDEEKQRDAQIPKNNFWQSLWNYISIRWRTECGYDDTCIDVLLRPFFFCLAIRILREIQCSKWMVWISIQSNESSNFNIQNYSF